MHPTARPIAYSYQRFSTGGQADGDSLIRQSSLAASYAREHNLQLDETVTFRDLGVSGFRGRNAQHGALAAFLQIVKTGRIVPGSYLLIESLDRLSRDNILRAQAVLTELVVAGINVVSLIDQRLYSTKSLSSDPIGLIYALLVFMRANEESETKSLRSREAWKRRREAAAGQAIFVKAPFWLSAEGDSIRPIPERCDLVKRVFALYMEGDMPPQIAAKLNSDGIPRWSFPGQPWAGSLISKILTNRRTTGALPFYTNVFERGVTVRVPHSVIPDYYPRVIEPELFLEAQALIPDGKRRSARARRNVLATIARCSECGRPLQLIPISLKRQYVLACQASRIGFHCSAPEATYDSIMSVVRPAMREWITTEYLWRTQVVNRPLFLRLCEALDSNDGSNARNNAEADQLPLTSERDLEDALSTNVRGRSRHLHVGSRICKYLDDPTPTSSDNIGINLLLLRLFSTVVIDLRSSNCVFYDDQGEHAFSASSFLAADAPARHAKATPPSAIG